MRVAYGLVAEVEEEDAHWLAAVKGGGLGTGSEGVEGDMRAEGRFPI